MSSKPIERAEWPVYIARLVDGIVRLATRQGLHGKMSVLQEGDVYCILVRVPRLGERELRRVARG